MLAFMHCLAISAFDQVLKDQNWCHMLQKSRIPEIGFLEIIIWMRQRTDKAIACVCSSIRSSIFLSQENSYYWSVGQTYSWRNHLTRMSASRDPFTAIQWLHWHRDVQMLTSGDRNADIKSTGVLRNTNVHASISKGTVFKNMLFVSKRRMWALKRQNRSRRKRLLRGREKARLMLRIPLELLYKFVPSFRTPVSCEFFHLWKDFSSFRVSCVHQRVSVTHNRCNRHLVHEN